MTQIVFRRWELAQEVWECGQLSQGTQEWSHGNKDYVTGEHGIARSGMVTG